MKGEGNGCGVGGWPRLRGRAAPPPGNRTDLSEMLPLPQAGKGTLPPLEGPQRRRAPGRLAEVVSLSRPVYRLPAGLSSSWGTLAHPGGCSGPSRPSRPCWPAREVWGGDFSPVCPPFPWGPKTWPGGGGCSTERSARPHPQNRGPAPSNNQGHSSERTLSPLVCGTPPLHGPPWPGQVMPQDPPGCPPEWTAPVRHLHQHYIRLPEENRGLGRPRAGGSMPA